MLSENQFGNKISPFWVLFINNNFCCDCVRLANLVFTCFFLNWYECAGRRWVVVSCGSTPMKCCLCVFWLVVLNFFFTFMSRSLLKGTVTHYLFIDSKRFCCKLFFFFFLVRWGIKKKKSRERGITKKWWSWYNRDFLENATNNSGFPPPSFNIFKTSTKINTQQIIEVKTLSQNLIKPLQAHFFLVKDNMR